MESIVDPITRISSYNQSTSVDHSEEQRYRNLIRKTFPHVVIDEVKKLNNKYTYAAFMLKKCEKPNYRVIELIHSTAASNVDSIEKNNFDWRLVQRAKYGYGVSFSGNADYANYHSSWSGGTRRAYIICDVLVDSIQITDTCQTVPTSGYDTVRSRSSYVYVKFDDFTFYPKYALYYQQPSKDVSMFNRTRRSRW